jgi:PAS domain S-box-containing protein
MSDTILTAVHDDVEQKFKTLFESSPLGISMNDSHGMFLRVNEAFQRIVGYSEGELTAMNFARITYPDDLAESKMLFGELVAGLRKDFRVEKRYIRKDGQVVWANTMCSAVRDAAGNFVFTFAMVEDITERKRAEEALQNLVAGTASVTGGEFFPALVRHLALALDVRMAVVTECVDQTFAKARILSRWKDSQWDSGVEYETHNTPCSVVLNGSKICYYPDHVQDHFPGNEFLPAFGAVCYLGAPLFDPEGRTIGHVYVVGTKALSDGERAKSIISIFAARAAMELLRKRAVDALERATGELRFVNDLIEQTTQPLAVTELEGQLLRFNHAFESLTGYTRGELLTLSYQRLTPEQWHDFEAAQIRKLLDGGGAVRYEKEYQRKDGTTVPIELVVDVYKDGAGRPKFLYAFVTDITQRKKEEEALHNLVAGTATVTGEEFFPALVRHLAAAVGVRYALVSECADAQGDRVRSLAYWKDNAWQQSFEYDVKDTTCEAVLKEGKLCFYPDHVQELFPKEPDLVTMKAVCYLGVPLFDSAGKPLGHIFVIDDKPLADPERAKSVISIFAARAAMELQRKRAEDQIREQAALLDRAHDAILVGDLEKRILFWSQGAERLYGWTKAEALGRRTTDLLFTEDETNNDEGSLHLLFEKGDWSGELRHRTKNGKEVVVQSRWTLVRDGTSGEPKSILMINTDVTEKKQLEMAFLRAQRIESIGTLAGGVAHDLNNVLTPILLAVETLLAHKVDERTHDLLVMIESNAKRGADMANQVLTFARGAEGSHVLLDPRRLIKEVEKIVRGTFPPSVQLQTKLARGLWQISGNATQLHQVLLNLCVNARDAMPGGGILKISTENITLDENYTRMRPDIEPGRYVAIAVSDTGSGIPPDVMDRVFEPFFTTKEVGKGTGLGLATVSGIVKGHGGFVDVESEIGKGTTFRVYLRAADAHEAVKQEELPVLIPGNGELVLIVDDEASIREMTRTTLEAHGYRAMCAGDGTEALSAYAKHTDEIKVVLTDMMMPYMDGAATIRALHKMNPAVKIIASSGMPGAHDTAESVSSRVKAFMSKPYTAEKLLTTLHEVLKHK